MAAPPKVLLLVEDEPELRKLIAEGLSDLGMEICAAANAEEALQLAGPMASRIALVLSDYSMPGLSGAELIPALRVLGVDCPSILISGEDRAKEGENAGASAYISKPCAVSRIRSVIAQLLGHAAVAE